MKAIYRSVCRSAFALLFVFLPTLATAERLALVVGNDGYENLPLLEKARNDARAVADVLRELGYDAVLLEDADRKTMSKAISDIASRIEPGAEVVFYFAGHGVEIAGRNYLVPTDAPAAGPDDEAFLTGESIAVNQILETIQMRGARVALLILDACRDNPFPKANTRSVGGARGLAPITAPEGAFILYSAGTGQAALDGMGARDDNPNSVFTRVLLPMLKEQDQPVQDMARALRREVEALASSVNHKQRPAYYDELTDDFFLASAAAGRGAKPIDAPPDSSDIAVLDKLGSPPPEDPTDSVADEPPQDGVAAAAAAVDLAEKEAEAAAKAARNEAETAVEEARKATDLLTEEAPKADDDNPFHLSVDQIPETLADDPCFYAGNEFVMIEYPYKIDDLLAFAERHAGCDALAQSAIDLASALQETDPALLVPETWRVKQGVSDGHMNVRDGRGTDFPVLFRIPAGAGGFTVKICMPPETAGTTKDWCLIEYEGQRGWISSGGIERE